MSTSSAIEKSGAVAFDSAMRRLTVCWRRVSSWTSASPLAPASPRCGSRASARCGASCGRTVALLGAVGPAPGPPLSAAACTSAFTIRPPGPEPSSRASSTPSSRAMRRATGDAFTRPPSPLLGARSLVAVPAWVSPPPSPAPATALASPSAAAPTGSRCSCSASSPAFSSSGSAFSCFAGFSPRLARLADARDQLADGERVALLGHDLDQRAVGVGLVGHVGLVRLDLHERLAALDLAALLDQPLEDRALLHRVGQAGHRDVVAIAAS